MPTPWTLVFPVACTSPALCPLSSGLSLVCRGVQSGVTHTEGFDSLKLPPCNVRYTRSVLPLQRFQCCLVICISAYSMYILHTKYSTFYCCVRNSEKLAVVRAVVYEHNTVHIVVYLYDTRSILECDLYYWPTGHLFHPTYLSCSSVVVIQQLPSVSTGNPSQQ